MSGCDVANALPATKSPAGVGRATTASAARMHDLPARCSTEEAEIQRDVVPRFSMAKRAAPSRAGSPPWVWRFWLSMPRMVREPSRVVAEVEEPSAAFGLFADDEAATDA